MILATRHLFLALLRTLRIDTVCDVGSMNGAEALTFRRMLPRARVCAFEPNPHNLQLMRADARLAAASIELLPFAVSDAEGMVTFHLVDADYTQAHHRRGMSSLYERGDAALRAAPVTVQAVRLDRCLAVTSGAPRRMALWIDVEGKAFEALAGARAILDEVLLLHVEVESQPCIAAGQKLYPEVRALLEAAGFEELGTDWPYEHEQFNAVFLRRGMPPSLRARVSIARTVSALRHRLLLALRRFCPACYRRLRNLATHSACDSPARES